MKKACFAVTLLALALLSPSSLFATPVQAHSASRIDVAPDIRAVPLPGSAAGFFCPTIVGADQSICSEDWAGYAVTGADGSVASVNGSWVVPRVSCSGVSSTFASFWVGIDGAILNSSTVEQVGTDSDCQFGSPAYYAWYEFYPSPAVAIVSVSVAPGDLMTASVSYSSSAREFTTSIESSGGGANSTSQSAPGALRNSAEWIAERPSDCSSSACIYTTLAPFGTASFGPGFTRSNSTDYATLGETTGPISKFSTVAITMVAGDAGPVIAQPTPLSGDGASFQVNSSGTVVALTCAPDRVTVGSPTLCKAQVVGISPEGTLSSPAPTGRVTWRSNETGTFSSVSCRLLSGACSVRYTPASAGSPVAVSASYGGDINYRPSSASFSVAATQMTPKISVTCAPALTRAESTKLARCTAVVTGFSPTGAVTWSQSGSGSVTFEGNRCVLSDGRCSVSLAGVTAGAVSVNATYGGDQNNAPSSKSGRLTVGTAKTTLSVSCTSTSLALGTPARCTATLTGYAGAVAGENITWTKVSGLGGVSLSSSSCTLSSAGACSVTVTGVSSPSVRVRAAYAGDSNNAGSFATVTFRVA